MQTTLYKPIHLFLSRFFSTMLAPYFLLLNLFRKSFYLRKIKVQTILVTEMHRIGDVFIIEPILKSLKINFPEARLILVCCKQVESLARDLSLADEILGIDVPWTNWNWSISKWLSAYSFSQKLRNRNIDLAFDFKGDIRNSWFLWNMRPKISFGYDLTGGRYFFTNPIKMNQKIHQRERGFELLQELDGFKREATSLFVSKKEGSVVIHPGASDKKRSWPKRSWNELIKLLVKNHKVSIVNIESSTSLIKELKEENILFETFSGDLIKFNRWLKKQKMIISPDSMAGHLAAYNGIPSITLFGSQNPNLTFPINQNSIIIAPNNSCKHKRDHWRLCKECISSIGVEKVYDEAINLINKLKNKI